MGKDVTLWNEDGMLDKLRFLPGAELVNTPPSRAEDFDALVALDTATYTRLGTPLKAIGETKLTINVDHHISNPGLRRPGAHRRRGSRHGADSL